MEKDPRDGRTARETKMLRLCAEAILSSKEESQMLRNFCQAIVDQMGYPLVWLGIPEPDSSVSVAASAGMAIPYALSAAIRWDDSPLGQGPTGRCARTGLPQSVPDLARSPAHEPWREGLAEAGLRSSAALPVALDGKVMAVLNLYSDQLGEFPEPDLDIFSVAASHLALGLDRLRRDSALERQKSQLDFKSQQLEKAYDLLMSITENLPLPLAVLTRELEWVHENQTFAQQFHFPRGVFVGGQRFWAQAFPESRYRSAVLRELRAAMLRDEPPLDATWYLLNGKGERRKCRFQFIRLDSANFMLCVRDIHQQDLARKELLRAQARLRASEQRLRLSVQAAGQGIFDLDFKTGTTIVSGQYAAQLGYPSDTFVESEENWSARIHPDDKTQTTAAFESCQSGQTPNFKAEFRMRHAHGHWVWLLALGRVVEHAPDGSPARMVGIHTDITYQKEMELRNLQNQTALARKEERLRLSLKAARQGLYDLDLATGAAIFNDEYALMLGHQPEDFRESNALWLERMHPDDREAVGQAFLDYVAGKTTEYIVEFRQKKADGQWVWILSMGKIVSHAADGTPLRMLGTHTDITQRKAIEQELLQAKLRAEESDRLKTEFINNMSHEVRTPLNGILGFAQILEKPDMPPEKRRRFSRIIQNSGQQLLRVMEDILEISKLGTQKVRANLADINLNELLWELFAIFEARAKEKGLALYLSLPLPDERSVCRCDAFKLNKIIGNLLENALKFTFEGHVELGYLHKDEQVEIYVNDTGEGIAPELRDRVFERFAQGEKTLARRLGGLGLGLAIARENAQILQGKLWVTDNPPKGSSFRLLLPTQNPGFGSQETMQDLDAKPPLGFRPKLLIAEDEELNFLLLKVLIQEEMALECQILHAKDGQEAVELCLEHPDIALLLIDLKMPVLNGLEATATIRGIRPKLPIIMQTAYSRPEERILALNAGCDDFLTKPIGRNKLQAVIFHYLGIRQ